MSHKEELRRLLKGDVKGDPETPQRHSSDLIAFRLAPEVVVSLKNWEGLNEPVHDARKKKSLTVSRFAVINEDAYMGGIPGALFSLH